MENSHSSEDQTPPSPVVTVEEIAAACAEAEAAVHRAVALVDVATERAHRAGNVSLAAVLNARAALCSRAALMLGLSSVDVRVQLADAVLEQLSAPSS